MSSPYTRPAAILKARIDADILLAHDGGGRPNTYWVNPGELAIAESFCLPPEQVAHLGPPGHLPRYAIYSAILCNKAINVAIFERPAAPAQPAKMNVLDLTSLSAISKDDLNRYIDRAKTMYGYTVDLVVFPRSAWKAFHMEMTGDPATYIDWIENEHGRFYLGFDLPEDRESYNHLVPPASEVK